MQTAECCFGCCCSFRRLQQANDIDKIDSAIGPSIMCRHWLLPLWLMCPALCMCLLPCLFACPPAHLLVCLFACFDDSNYCYKNSLSFGWSYRSTAKIIVATFKLIKTQIKMHLECEANKHIQTQAHILAKWTQRLMAAVVGTTIEWTDAVQSLSSLRSHIGTIYKRNIS